MKAIKTAGIIIATAYTTLTTVALAAYLWATGFASREATDEWINSAGSEWDKFIIQ
jgi:hypothetical protein